MKRWHAHRRWVYWGLVLLIAADIAVYVGWLRGLAQRVQVDPATLESVESEVAQRSAEVARLRRVREQAPTAAPRLDAFARERFWSEAEGYSRTLAELTETAKSAGVRISGTQYRESQFKERPEMLQLQINTSSTMSLFRSLTPPPAGSRSPESSPALPRRLSDWRR